MIIEGRQVLDTEPDFSTPPQRVAKRGFLLTGLGFARRTIAYPGEITYHAMTLEFLFQQKSDIEAFQDFFDLVAGKWGDFWVPSWHAELNPLADLLTGTAQLSITQVGYNAVYLGNPDTTRLGHYVWLKAITGEVHISKVLACADGSPEILTLETPAPSDFRLGQFVVGFLYLVRFVNDNLALDFEGPEEAHATVAVIEVMQATGAADV